ncbi:HTH cro/C1-type domain-containing protein [Rariglobus hedericola]
MSYIGIAHKAGTISSSIEKLISHGQGSPGLASRLGTTSSSITTFIGGRASPSIASALGTTTSNAQALRNAIGREGAIGLIIGLACGRGETQQ